MSLESCVACGHALAIADQRCRHCSPAPFGTHRRIKGMELHLLIALAALVLAVLIYLVFLR